MDDKVNSVVEGINGKNGQLVLLALALVGFGFLIYTIVNQIFGQSERQFSAMFRKIDETQQKIDHLEETIQTLIIRIEQTHK